MNKGEEFLQHHGVLGMKWGVRKDRGSKQKTPRTKRKTKIPLKPGWTPAVTVKNRLYKNDKLWMAAVLPPLAIPIGMAMLTDEALARRKGKKNLAKALGVRTKDINRKDLKVAGKMVAEYGDLVFTSGDKTIKMTDLNLEEVLQHHGVLGMKWGVRRFQPYPKGSKKGEFLGKTKKKISESRPAQELRSAKRNLQVAKTRMNLNNMSTSEIKKATERLRLENEMKSLTPKIAYTKNGMKQVRKEQKDYRNRSQMTDQEIKRKVDRLRTKKLYSQNASKANDAYIKTGKRVIQSAVSIGAKYSSSGNKISVGDVLESVVNPNAGSTKAIYESLTKKITK